MIKHDIAIVQMIVLLAGIGVAVGWIPFLSNDLKTEPSKREGRSNLLFSKLWKFFPPINIKIVNILENDVDDTGETDETTVSDFCLLANGSRVANGVSYKEFCDTLTCVDGEITGRVVPTYRTDCPSDFDQVSDLGCVKLIRTPTELWCDARRKCFAMGADLVSLSAEQGVENLTPLTDYVRTDQSFNDEVWVGLWRTNSDLWDWTIGGGQITSDSDIFTASDPNGASQFQCNRLTGTKLGDRFCDDDADINGGNFAYVCEVPGFG